MNYGIVIYENDDYLFKLLKFRLQTFFPDGYIIRGAAEITSQSLPFAESVHLIYDSNQYTFEQICRYSDELNVPVTVFPLFNEVFKNIPTIDCSYLYDLISKTGYEMKNEQLNVVKAENIPSGKLCVFLPFSYIDERETFISNHLNHLTNSLMCLRLDLMSGIRMPYTFSGVSNGTIGLTDLLISSRNDDLTPEKILSYCAPDNKGFLTPGKPKNSDDVFDYDIKVIENIISNASELTSDSSYPMNVLVVAEGYKIANLSKIAAHADELHILLPRRLYKDDLGFKEEIGKITRTVSSNVHVAIHYTEELKMDSTYETMQI